MPTSVALIGIALLGNLVSGFSCGAAMPPLPTTSLSEASCRLRNTLMPTHNRSNSLSSYSESWFHGGGTRFDSVLHHAGSIIDKTPKADVLMITDGHSTVSEHKISMINAIKARTGTQWTTICLEVEPTIECYRFSDDVYSVNLDKPADAIDAIQKSIR